MKKSRIRLIPDILLLSIYLSVPTQASERPNILLVYTDDQASWTVGALGNEQAVTPNLDRLIREGANLVNSFVTTPVCSPSRAGLMVSRYGTEIGITDWINHTIEPDSGLGPDLVTFTEVLDQAGYTNGLVGKWHLGVAEQFHPKKHGFHFFTGFLHGGVPPENPRLEVEGTSIAFEGLTPDVLTDQALGFIRKNQDQPFFLAMNYRAPHRRWLPVADQDWAPYEALDPAIPNPGFPQLDVQRVARMTREYLASVSSMDRNLGRLLAGLKAMGLDERTIVIFTSDNGYNIGHSGVLHKGNGHWALKNPPPATENIPLNQRPNLLDNSLRVPTVVRWPGVIDPGTIVQHTVTNLDWYPTIVELAGAELPDGQTIRGRSIVPLLKGAEIEWNDDLYAEYSATLDSRAHLRMYRTARWKIVRDFLNPGRDEFYDLEKDPGEVKNLILDDRAEIQSAIAALDQKLLQKMIGLGDPILVKQPAEP